MSAQVSLKSHFLYQMRIKHIVLYATILLTAALSSCDNGYNCSLNNVAYNRMGFYSLNGNTIESGYNLPAELEISMMINGQQTDVIGNGNKGVQLPMSYTHECDTVLFSYSSGLADTIYVQHSNIPFYQSMECGTVMYHNIRGVEYTRNLIDSIAVADKFVNFDENETLKVYFIE